MKIKTGSKNSKIGTPRIEPVAKTILQKKEKMPRVAKQESEVIPTWIKESSEKKPKRAEWSESKLQWRKETKKSQRSFSKNKEREYMQSKSEVAPSNARGGFRNTFDKAAIYEGSRGDTNTKEGKKGFEKSKTGYKWFGSAWDKSKSPRISTRTWDDISDNTTRPTDISKRVYVKTTTMKEPKKYIPLPKPSWEKDITVIDKKKLIDPTK
jgi:hypothetical protein